MDVLFSAATALESQADLLVVGLRSDGSLTAELGELGSALREALVQERFTGEAGRCLTWPTFGKSNAVRLCIVGVGKGNLEDLRKAAGAAGTAARGRGDTKVELALGALNGEEQGVVVEAFAVGNYRDDRYRAAEVRRNPASQLTFLGAEPGDLALAKAIAAGQELARDLVNAPAEDLFPATLAEAALKLARPGLSVEVWDEVRIRAEGMGGITAVGKGSDKPARFIHMIYRPEGSPRRKLGLIGKGVTFDAGGLSLKTPDGMLTMRCDMGGAAAVVGAMRAIAELAPDVEVHGIIGAVENMLGGRAYKLGDILTMHNGTTVEIHNTDAEGRLVLADCLSYASRLGLDAMVDLATLTGACVVALGDLYSALYSHEDGLAASLSSCAAASGEKVWRMPLEPAYKEKIKGDFGTLKNVGGPQGGSITAALFLSEFVGQTPWAHLDIAGPAFFSRQTAHFAPGGTGALVPTLVRYVLQ